MSAMTNPRKRTVRIEVGADARSYVSDGQRVTLVPLGQDCWLGTVAPAPLIVSSWPLGKTLAVEWTKGS